MGNVEASFITQRTGNYGSSLYYVTRSWVIRCSGNSAEGRIPTTFIRQREIVYIKDGRSSATPTLGAFPREGEHDGNAIVEILPSIKESVVPRSWVSVNGISWAAAVKEIDDAIEYAQKTQIPRASRVVGSSTFKPD